MIYDEAQRIYLKFQAKYSRATNYFLRLYNISEVYVVEVIMKESWIRWKNFKKLVKWVDGNINLKETTYYDKDTKRMLSKVIVDPKNPDKGQQDLPLES